MPAHFADLSNNNGPAVRVDEIDADAVILKASEGASFTDGYRATWQAGLEARGIPCGTYHFHRGGATPTAQLARWTADGLDTGALRPVLDCEDTSKTIGPDAMAANCLELAELVANHCGVAPIIYTGGWWLGTYATRDPAWARYDLWLSAYPLGYSRQPTDAEAATWLAAGRYCTPPAPWPAVAAWQYTSIAAQAGIPGNSDRSIVADDVWPHLFRTAPNPAPSPEDDMPLTLITRDSGDPGIWVNFGDGFRTHVPTTELVQLYQFLGAKGPTPIRADWFDNLVDTATLGGTGTTDAGLVELTKGLPAATVAALKAAL